MANIITKLVYDSRLKIVLLWLTFVLGNIDLIENEEFYIIIFSDFFLSSFTLLLARSKYRLIRYSAVLFIGMAILLSVINYFSFSLFQLGVSVKLCILLLETTTNESLQYLTQLLPHIERVGVAWLIIPLVFLGGRTITRLGHCRLALILFMGFNILGFLASAYVVSQPFGKKRISIVCRSMLDLHSAIKIKRSSHLFLHQNNYFPHEARIDSANFDKIILIIGESMSKFHMSLYDYKLETTPCLDSMRDSLFIFQDVVSPFTGTSEVMQCLLTFKSVEDTLSWYEYPSLMDVLSQTEYKTFWFSNQEKAGAWGDCSGIISSKADSVKYVGMEYSGDHSYEAFDEKLIEEFRMSVQLNQKQFFILHMMGSHPLYNRRYPQNKSKFKKSDYDLAKFSAAVCQTKSEYDNSVRYTDSLLCESIRIIRDSCPDERVLWIYVSDHGQDVFDFSENVGHVAQSVEVPLILYLNEKARQDNPLQTERLGKSLTKQIMTDDLIHTLFMLMNISYPVIDSSKSFISDTFIEKTRITDGKQYRYKPAERVKSMQQYSF